LKLSIGILAYNRPLELQEALNSIASGCKEIIEVVVSEDCSPKKKEIEAVVIEFRKNNPLIQTLYFSNKVNLGYDHNLRSLLDKCTGEYVFFMGDDDRILPGSIKRVLDVLENNSVAVVLRAWQSFDKKSGDVLDVHHYFRGDRFFNAGQATIAAFYRRSVFISGLTVSRQAAQKLHTNTFDGLLLYQLYLVGMLLDKSNGYYIDDILLERRVGGEHFFGSSNAEKLFFKPNKLNTEHSIQFISGLYKIAEFINTQNPGVEIYIYRDIGMYSYPMLEIQASQCSRSDFALYGLRLSKLGLFRTPMFWFYYLSLLFFGPKVCNFLIRKIIEFLGHTPLLGGSNGADPNPLGK